MRTKTPPAANYAADSNKIIRLWRMLPSNRSSAEIEKHLRGLESFPHHQIQIPLTMEDARKSSVVSLALGKTFSEWGGEFLARVALREREVFQVGGGPKVILPTLDQCGDFWSVFVGNNDFRIIRAEAHHCALSVQQWSYLMLCEAWNCEPRLFAKQALAASNSSFAIHSSRTSLEAEKVVQFSVISNDTKGGVK